MKTEKVQVELHGHMIEIEKRGDKYVKPDILKRLEGYNAALKPGYEPIILAQRPRDGTFANNALRWGCGGLAIDACRLGTGDDLRGGQYSGTERARGNCYGEHRNLPPEMYAHPTGRWPANVLLQHCAPHPCACGGEGDCPDCGGSGIVPGCERVGVRRVRGTAPSGPNPGNRGMFIPNGDGTGWGRQGYADPDGKETVEAWACAPGCPVAMVGAQSGESVSRDGGKSGTAFCAGQRGEPRSDTRKGHNDTGTAARFFLNLPPDGARFRYQAKAARRERNDGLDDFYWRRDDDSPAGFVRVSREEWEALGERQRAVGNVHPTVKPVILAEWLSRLTLPPPREDGEEPRRILDPFVGSGSTLLGALEAGWDEATGIDIVREYCDIAEGRLAAWARAHRQPQLEGIER